MPPVADITRGVKVACLINDITRGVKVACLINDPLTLSYCVPPLGLYFTKTFSTITIIVMFARLKYNKYHAMNVIIIIIIVNHIHNSIKFEKK